MEEVLYFDEIILKNEELCKWYGFKLFLNKKNYSNINDFISFVKKINVDNPTNKFIIEDYIHIYSLIKFETFVKELNLKKLKLINNSSLEEKKKDIILNILLTWIKKSKINEEILYSDCFIKSNIMNKVIIMMMKNTISNLNSKIKKSEKINEKLLCIVCISNIVSTIGKNCKHLSCCKSCSVKLNNICPICRNNGGFEYIYLN